MCCNVDGPRLNGHGWHGIRAPLYFEHVLVTFAYLAPKLIAFMRDLQIAGTIEEKKV